MTNKTNNLTTWLQKKNKKKQFKLKKKKKKGEWTELLNANICTSKTTYNMLCF